MASVHDVLDDQNLGLRALHLARPDAEVRWVAVSELADPTPFLDGGEIVLTTALEMASWGQEWNDYVRRLAAAEVSALGLAIDLTLAAAPQELLEAAERWQVNLIEVPQRTTFVAISRAVAELLRTEDTRAAQRSLEMHQALTRAAARSDDPKEILRALAEALKGVAAILGTDGVVRVGPVGAIAFDAAAIAEETLRIRPGGLHAAASMLNSTGTVILQPIGVRGRPTRYFAAGFEGPATPVHHSTIAAAVALLNLAEERRNDRMETHRKLAARAIELLIHGDTHGASLLLGASGNDGGLPSTCLVLRAAGSSEDVEEALELMDLGETPGVVAVVEGELVAIGRTRTIMDLARIASARLRTGVGREVPSTDIGVGYRIAGLALANAQVGVTSEWSKNTAAGITALLGEHQAQAFSEATLFGLDENLMTTLSAFLRHHGSPVGVARDLGIHRNTVMQRVRAIETQLHRSLDDPQTRVDTWVALQVAAANIE